MKALAGKRWFYSCGQRSMSVFYMGPWPSKDWPAWARAAYYEGREDEYQARMHRDAALSR